MIQGVEADRLNALKTVAEVSVAAALHADTTRGKNKQTNRNQYCGGLNENGLYSLLCLNACSPVSVTI